MIKLIMAMDALAKIAAHLNVDVGENFTQEEVNKIVDAVKEMPRPSTPAQKIYVAVYEHGGLHPRLVFQGSTDQYTCMSTGSDGLYMRLGKVCVGTKAPWG